MNMYVYTYVYTICIYVSVQKHTVNCWVFGADLMAVLPCASGPSVNGLGCLKAGYEDIPTLKCYLPAIAIQQLPKRPQRHKHPPYADGQIPLLPGLQNQHAGFSCFCGRLGCMPTCYLHDIPKHSSSSEILVGSTSPLCNTWTCQASFVVYCTPNRPQVFQNPLIRDFSDCFPII